MALKGRVWLIAACAAASACASGTINRSSFEQTYLATDHDWLFRKQFPRADRLLNAFDYGHAILYQTLLTRSNAAERLEGPEFEFIARTLLRNPPKVPLDEETIGPAYTRLVPELVATFEWAHMLHRQIYDACAAPNLTDTQRDAAIARVLAYYRSRKDLALSTRPKSMALMEGQQYSLAFRREAPKFNGLLWSYHWYQLALYDAMLVDRGHAEKAVDAVVTHFFGMLDNAPSKMPPVMPMAPTASPLFSDRYPEAAIIFDNLHALHDVASDIFASPIVPRDQKRAAVLAALATYRDDTTAVTTVAEWKEMAKMMTSAPHD